MKTKGNLYIGTSGWAYFWPEFYPEDLTNGERLGFFSKHFNTVEINYSFYHLPKPATFEKWFNQTPKHFVFAVKLSRFITHIKRLKGVKEALRKFLKSAKVLGSKLGPILVQLPPSFKAQPKLLDSFLKTTQDLSKKFNISKFRLGLEVRHKTWFESEEALAVLKQHNTALVFAHSSRYPDPEQEPVTADFIYLRFHGPTELFASSYGAAGLKRWVPSIKKWLKQGKDVYAYFNNDAYGYAIRDAQALKQLLKKQKNIL